jgi:hypothetical protein
MAIKPSEDMRGFYEVGAQMDQHDEISSGLAPFVAELTQTTGADSAMMGWGILGVVRLLTPTINTLGKTTRLGDVASFTSGLASSLVAATVLGSDLISRGDGVLGGVSASGRPSLPNGLNGPAGTLPDFVAGVEQTLREQLIAPSLADPILDLLAARGDFATSGLLPSLATELPGLDLAHAGVGQLGCGVYFFNGGVRAERDAAEGHKRGRARRKEAATVVSRDSGLVVFGALMVLAGDQCLAVAAG